METINAVHLKVEFNNEFRRFAIPTLSYKTLESTVRSLFGLSEGDTVTVKFQDDEKDWVLLSSDQELAYAVEISGSPLRLSVKTARSAVQTPNADFEPEPEQPSPSNADPSIVLPVFPVMKRGGRGGRGGKADLSVEERLSLKTTRLSSRIAQLEEKINSNTLNSDRERVLRWRLLGLQQKLSDVNARKNSPNEQIPTPEVVGNPPEVPAIGRCASRTCRGRGGRGRGGKFAQPSEHLTLVRQCKVNLRIARESGNQAEIANAENALQQAREKKRQANPEFAGLISKKNESLFALREARQSGDADRIQYCLATFTEAKSALQEAKSLHRDAKDTH